MHSHKNYVNGLNPVILLEWVTVNKLCAQVTRIIHTLNASGRKEYLNGEIRLYNRPAN